MSGETLSRSLSALAAELETLRKDEFSATLRMAGAAGSIQVDPHEPEYLEPE